MLRSSGRQVDRVDKLEEKLHDHVHAAISVKMKDQVLTNQKRSKTRSIVNIWIPPHDQNYSMFSLTFGIGYLPEASIYLE